jgi:hypothetical protein
MNTKPQRKKKIEIDKKHKLNLQNITVFFPANLIYLTKNMATYRTETTSKNILKVSTRTHDTVIHRQKK